MKLVIIAGGKGTRLGLKDIPKPMVEIDSKPLLEHQILLAKRYGIEDIYILSGHLSEVIIDYCGDGSKWNVKITHIVEEIALGTAGAIKQLENTLNDRFIVFYGDTIMDINLANFIEFDTNHNDSIGNIIVHPNDHPHDSDLVEIDKEDKVIQFHSKPHIENKYYANLVNAALYILSPKIFSYIEKDKMLDFGKDIFPLIIKNHDTMYAYKTTEYLKDMGTPKRLKKVEQDIKSGKVSRLNLTNKQKAIFIDRDGVINREVDNLSDIEDLEILEGVTNAISKINHSEYIAIVITNQPAIAKGFITEKELKEIHKKMDTILGQDGAYTDDLFYCSHHPASGFEGEIKELKIDCECRKPEIGLFLEAAKKYNIDLSKSWMIGDRYVDIKAGKDADCKTVLVKTGHNGSDRDKYLEVKPTLTCKNLDNAVNMILSDKKIFVLGEQDDNN
jgi:D,D-heptose 1,7-bisphosphate phosphatase